MDYRLTPVNFDQDSEFLLHCLQECWDSLEKHVSEQPVQAILDMEYRVSKSWSQVYLAVKDNEAVGVFSTDFEGDIATIHGLLLPKHRKGWTAYIFLKMFIDIAFEKWNLFKLKAKINPRNRAAEKILRRAGFKKAGVLFGEWMGVVGRENAILLALINPALDERPDKKAKIKKSSKEAVA